MFSLFLELLSALSAIGRRSRFLAALQVVGSILAFASFANAFAPPQPKPNQTCFRPAEGSLVSNPPELRSQNGVLELTLRFRYRQTLMGEGPVRYCYMTDSGEVAPTLRVQPGDRLIIHFINEAPVNKYSSSPTTTVREKQDCSDPNMGFYSTNLHFHGMRVPPLCHQDDVLHTYVQPGQKFDYDVRIPADQPPGLYWYHPHVHGITEGQVQGGASGALIVDGIEKQRPALAGMPQRVFVVRDQQLTPSLDHAAPTWDVSINFVPVLYPTLLPASVETPGHQKEFWRVVNAGADTILDLELLSAGKAQKLQLIALDGVAVEPANSSVENIPLPPGSRAEFVVETPNAGEHMQLITRRWDTGPAGDSDPQRPLAQIVSKESAAASSGAPVATAPIAHNNGNLLWKGPTLERRLYFSESSPNPGDPDISTFFFITEVGHEPEQFKMGSPPDIVLHQGGVEAWTVENRSAEDHVFHIHQLHFQVLAIDGKPVHDTELRDTINVSHWNGEGPYPSVRLLMDFRGPNVVGTFPYHCHIEKHADMGMMGTVEVLPRGAKTAVRLNFLPASPQMGDQVKFTASVASQNHAGPPPTGEVQLNVDGLNMGKRMTLSHGQAVFEAFFPDKGDHVVKAMYWGDTAHTESASESTVVKVR